MLCYVINYIINLFVSNSKESDVPFQRSEEKKLPVPTDSNITIFNAGDEWRGKTFKISLRLKSNLK